MDHLYDNRSLLKAPAPPSPLRLLRVRTINYGAQPAGRRAHLRRGARAPEASCDFEKRKKKKGGGGRAGAIFEVLRDWTRRSKTTRSETVENGPERDGQKRPGARRSKTTRRETVENDTERDGQKRPGAKWSKMTRSETVRNDPERDGQKRPAARRSETTRSETVENDPEPRPRSLQRRGAESGGGEGGGKRWAGQRKGAGTGAREATRRCAPASFRCLPCP